MQVHAITRDVRMSAQKMREMVRQIQGLPALQAQAVLAVVPRKSARVVAKTLQSAIANAAHIQSEWEGKAAQNITDLEKLIENTRNRKRKNKLTRRLARYQSFADSSKHLAPESLIVKEAVAETSRTLKRFVPKARGSAGPILKRSCHVRIVLSDE
jgi:large subunit ribosomal protein L22